MLRSLLISLSLILPLALQAQPAQTSNDAFNQVNAIRGATRMNPLTYSSALSRAAQNHATYLSKNVGRHFENIDMHSEKKRHAGFTGENASSRAHSIGYPYRDVKENISIGNKNIAASISGLMSGIYHRFTFLDFLIDTIGYGAAVDNTGFKTYVYNMGRKDMESVCTDLPEKARPDIPVDCLGTTVKANYIEKACTNIPHEAVYEPPFPMRCPNGKLLKARYMDSICKSPPAEILFNTEGSYFQICDPGIRVKAGWLESVCNTEDGPAKSYENRPDDTLTTNLALHNGDTRYYEICKSKTRVYASWLKNYCDSASISDQNTDSTYYKKPCHTEFKVSQTYLDTLDSQHYNSNPEHIIWPPFEASEVSPVFFDEMPDPLPDLDVSGYPLSVQFNPAKLKSVKLGNFLLEKKTDKGTWRRINKIRELNHNSDPQKIFSPLQFAWFPLQRLDWNRHYRASVIADIDGRKALIKWLFKTSSRGIPLPLLNVKPYQKKLHVPEGEWFTLYLAPSKRLSRPMKKASFKWREPAKVESRIIDFNTIKIRLENTHCQVVYLQMSQGRELTLHSCHF